jgi:hypothetical protein
MKLFAATAITTMMALAAPALASAHTAQVSVDCVNYQAVGTYTFQSFPNNSTADLALWIDGKLAKSGSAFGLNNSPQTRTLSTPLPVDGKSHNLYAATAWKADGGGYQASKTITCVGPTPPPQPTPTPTPPPAPTPTPVPPVVTPTPPVAPPVPPVVTPTPTPPPKVCKLTRVDKGTVRAGQTNTIVVTSNQPVVTITLPGGKTKVVKVKNGTAVVKVKPTRSGTAKVAAGNCSTIRITVKHKHRTHSHRPPKVTG